MALHSPRVRFLQEVSGVVRPYIVPSLQLMGSPSLSSVEIILGNHLRPYFSPKFKLHL